MRAHSTMRERRIEVPGLPVFPPAVPPHDQPSRRLAAEILRRERAADVARWNARRGFGRVDQ